MTTAMKEILDARHYRCLELVSEGLSNPVIAERLGLTHATVKHYMTDVYEYFDLHPYRGYDMRIRAVALFLKAN